MQFVGKAVLAVPTNTCRPSLTLLSRVPIDLPKGSAIRFTDFDDLTALVSKAK
jgi:hypothetical protein